MKLTLNELDQAFENIWQHPSQAQSLKEAWEEMVLEFLYSPEAFKTPYQEIADHLDFWDSSLQHRNVMAVASMQNVNPRLH